MAGLLGVDGGSDVWCQRRTTKQADQALARLPLANPPGGLAERGREISTVPILAPAA